MINQDRRSILISDDESNQQWRPIDHNFYKRKSVFERLGGSATSLLKTNIDTLKKNHQYQRVNEQLNTKRPKYDSNNIRAESYDQDKKSEKDKHQDSHPKIPQQNKSKGQTQDKVQDKSVQNKYLGNNYYHDAHSKSNQGYSQVENKAKHDHHSKMSRANERSGREGTNKNAHNRDTSRESHQSRRY